MFFNVYCMFLGFRNVGYGITCFGSCFKRIASNCERHIMMASKTHHGKVYVFRRSNIIWLFCKQLGLFFSSYTTKI